jgi:hypothetical protein
VTTTTRTRTCMYFAFGSCLASGEVWWFNVAGKGRPPGAEFSDSRWEDGSQRHKRANGGRTDVLKGNVEIDCLQSVIETAFVPDSTVNKDLGEAEFEKLRAVSKRCVF